MAARPSIHPFNYIRKDLFSCCKKKQQPAIREMNAPFPSYSFEHTGKCFYAMDLQKLDVYLFSSSSCSLFLSAVVVVQYCNALVKMFSSSR